MATTTLSASATSVSHDAMANAIRFLSLDAVEKAKSGHPGLPMGMADVATVLWRDSLTARGLPTAPKMIPTSKSASLDPPAGAGMAAMR